MCQCTSSVVLENCKTYLQVKQASSSVISQNIWNILHILCEGRLDHRCPTMTVPLGC